MSTLLRRIERALAVRLNCAALIARNLFSSQSVLGDPSAPVVSLTTFGRRTSRAFLAVESIAFGQAKPSRLILWIDDPVILGSLPGTLRRLKRRGVEIFETEDLGPHKKYFPAIQRLNICAGRPLVTADDDALYPRSWLGRLILEAERSERTIICYRARIIRVCASSIEPYANWENCNSSEPDSRVFAIGVSGVLYPQAMQSALRLEGDGFREACPTADDIWLHAVALRHKIPVRQVDREPAIFWTIPGSQTVALQDANVRLRGNDESMLRTYTSADIAILDQAQTIRSEDR